MILGGIFLGGKMCYMVVNMVYRWCDKEGWCKNVSMSLTLVILITKSGRYSFSGWFEDLSVCEIYGQMKMEFEWIKIKVK